MTILQLILAIVLGAGAFFGGMFLVKRLTGKKKDKSKPQDQQQAVDSEIQNLNSNKLRITIYRPVSDDLVAQVGNTIIAEEKKDANNSVLVINEEKKFKEDFNFSQDRIYEVMDFSLKMHNKTNKEKANILDKKIQEQEDLIISIEDDVELNKTHNFRDEEVKLRQMKVFRDSLRRERKGNYVRLGQGGIRQYEFVTIDGILYPYFFGARFYRVYPDLTVKKKIFNHENTVFKNETANLLNKNMNWIPVVILAIAIAFLLGNIYWTYKLSQSETDIALAANQGAITCENTLAAITKNYGGAVEDYLAIKKEELETLKKNQNNNNNNPNTNTNIKIDPTDLLNR